MEEDELKGLHEELYINEFLKNHRIVINSLIKEADWDKYLNEISSNKNLNNLLNRYILGKNNEALKEDNIYRINNLNLIEYSTFLSVLLNHKNKFCFRELEEIFDLTISEEKIIDLKLKKNISHLTKKSLSSIQKNNNFIYTISGLYNCLNNFEGDESIFQFNKFIKPPHDISYKGYKIPMSWKILFEVRELFETLLSFFMPIIPLRNIDSIKLLDNLLSKFLDDNAIKNNNSEIAQDFVTEIFNVYKRTNIPNDGKIKAYLNKIDNIENFVLLLFFLFKKDFFSVQKTNVFVLKLVRLFSSFKKGFSERSIYKYIELYSHEDIFEIPNCKLTNQILRNLQ